MLLLAFRSFFFIAVILGYSTGIWRLINDYFRREFKTFLDVEVKKNKYLVQDPPTTKEQLFGGVKGAAHGEPISEQKPGTGSVSNSRLVDELIVSFGRFFTSRNEDETSGRKSPTSSHHPPKLAPKPSPDYRNPSQVDPQHRSNYNNEILGPRSRKKTEADDRTSRKLSSCCSSSSSSSESEEGEDPGEDSDGQGSKIDTRQQSSDACGGNSPTMVENLNRNFNPESEEEKWINYWRNRGDDGGDKRLKLDPIVEGFCEGTSSTATSINDEEKVGGNC
ncbi:uncharacterized protein LOC129748596 [Uranotaenia lowii]|uniref:uncharacterized protein LOC129748596 n=1 Tax=Uranotaenia lowii TaxID=190385 RepID=UPI0024793032|nr:uncharacterized protein LOC129748596 [Uranotaenia lowii]